MINNSAINRNIFMMTKLSIYRMINEKQFQDAILANEKLQTLKIHGETLKTAYLYTEKMDWSWAWTK